MQDNKIQFGRVVIDKKHQFFGKPNPTAFVIADVYYTEEDGDDAEVWVDHYRGHFKIRVADLKDPNKYDILSVLVDTSENVHDQLENICESWEAMQGFPA